MEKYHGYRKKAKFGRQSREKKVINLVNLLLEKLWNSSISRKNIAKIRQSSEGKKLQNSSFSHWKKSQNPSVNCRKNVKFANQLWKTPAIFAIWSQSLTINRTKIAWNLSMYRRKKIANLSEKKSQNSSIGHGKQIMIFICQSTLNIKDIAKYVNQSQEKNYKIHQSVAKKKNYW